MNKFVKGSLAGAAGIALLLGGAGTFAYWNAEAGVSGGTIASGDLNIVNDGAAGVWTDQSGATIDPATYRIVPGDTLTYTDDLTVTAVGDNLEAELALAGGAIAPTSASAPADTALAGYLTANAVLTATGSAITGAGTAANTYVVREGTGAITTTVTIAFPLGGAGVDNDAKVGSVNLSSMALTLVQDH